MVYLKTPKISPCINLLSSLPSFSSTFPRIFFYIEHMSMNLHYKNDIQVIQNWHQMSQLCKKYFVLKRRTQKLKHTIVATSLNVFKISYLTFFLSKFMCSFHQVFLWNILQTLTYISSEVNIGFNSVLNLFCTTLTISTQNKPTKNSISKF